MRSRGWRDVGRLPDARSQRGIFENTAAERGETWEWMAESLRLVANRDPLETVATCELIAQLAAKDTRTTEGVVVYNTMAAEIEANPSTVLTLSGRAAAILAMLRLTIEATAPNVPLRLPAIARRRRVVSNETSQLTSLAG